ncbi:hypothetical protein DH2020_017190 [Rehmannia glutinosa]|uniref:Major facilitator superfamily (MFS) profile domain-containing protein n=1 Tax=Rehmannia glutinosa TaxID=99300 RepID=A0ABR0WTZ0_REHGL
MEGGVTKPDKTEFTECWRTSWKKPYIMRLALSAGIGGLLFGYDTGVISGALLYIRDDFKSVDKHTWLQETIVSMAVAGAIVGAGLGGLISDKYGRRISILLADILFFIGAIVMAASVAPWMIILGRIFVGLGVGMASMTSPLYISEASPARIRGALVSTNGLLITGGQFLSYLINLAFTKAPGTWRWMLGVAGVPALIQFVLMLSLPESPRFLYRQDKVKEARAILEKIYPANEVEEEMKALQSSIEAEKADDKSLGNDLYSKLKNIWGNDVVRRGLYAGVTVQVAQQFVGINTVMYYSPTIVQLAGFASNKTALALSLITSGLNAVGSIVSMCRGERRIWYTKGCPSKFGFFAVLLLGMYIISYSPGMGTVPWIVNSEIYPLRYRGIGGGIAAVSNWVSNLIVSETFLTLTEALGSAGTFLLFAGFSTIGLIAIYFVVPETKGLQFEEWFELMQQGSDAMGQRLTTGMAQGMGIIKVVHGEGELDKMTVLNPLDIVAMLAKGGFNRGSGGQGSNFGRGGNKKVQGTHVYGRGRGQPRRTKEEKEKLICEQCGYNGHEMKECFKLHGYPDWYKELKDQRAGQSINMVEGCEANTVKQQGVEEPKKGDLPDYSIIIQKEIAKYMSGLGNTNAGDIHTFSHFAEYSSTKHKTHFALSLLSTLDKDCWIVDTGASRHICSFPNLVTKSNLLLSPVTVHLPDGTSVPVTHSGNVQLSSAITLTDVLIVPSFKYNLLSISQLLEGNRLECVFSQGKCWLQDPKSGGVKAVGKALAGLYIFEGAEFGGSCSSSSEVADTLKIWHRRLGHSSLTCLEHIELTSSTNVPIQALDTPDENSFEKQEPTTISHEVEKLGRGHMVKHKPG